MKSSLDFSAVLLAAGRSSRMGHDKALLDAGGGRALWEQQRDLLTGAGAAEIFLSARTDQAWAHGAGGFEAVVHDAQPDLGPLAGIVAALGRSTRPHLAVLAVDLPGMDAGWWKILSKRCAPGQGAVGRRGKFFEPLAAIYPCELRSLAEAALAKRELSLQRLLADAVGNGLMQVREIAATESPWFENRNTPAQA